MSGKLAARAGRLEARRGPAGGRVRYAWWNPGEPKPEAATTGERLVVVSWADHPEAQDPAAPPP